MHMPRITIGYAILLIALGMVGYFALGRSSATALIPTFVGLIFLVMGIVAHKDALRQRMMHAAVVLAVVAVIGSVGGVVDVVSMLTGGEVARPAAAVSKAVMAILSLVYLGFSAKSFLAARRSATAPASRDLT